jgi:hypothetical protein
MQETQARVAKQEAKRENDVMTRWRRLIRFVMIRDRLRQHSDKQGKDDGDDRHDAAVCTPIAC